MSDVDMGYLRRDTEQADVLAVAPYIGKPLLVETIDRHRGGLCAVSDQLGVSRLCIARLVREFDLLDYVIAMVLGYIVIASES